MLMVILMNGKLKSKGLYRISVYFNEADLTSIVKDAEKAGFRRAGIPIKVQKPHGLADEWLANTDGIGTMLKNCYDYWKKTEPERLRELAEVQEQKRMLEAREAALEKGRASIKK